MKKTYKNTRKYQQSSENEINTLNDYFVEYQKVSSNHSLKYLLGLNNSPSHFDLINITRKGIQKEKLINISKYLGITQEKLSNLLHINLRTLQRIESTDNLDVFSSELAIEMAKVVETGMNFFNNPSEFQAWLNTPLQALNFQKPIDFLDTTFGCNVVASCIINMQHGVYA